MKLTDLFKGKTASAHDLAVGVVELDGRLVEIDKALAEADERLTQSQRQALTRGTEPTNIGTLHARVMTLRDRKKIAQEARDDLLGQLKASWPAERQRRLLALQEQEPELVAAQAEARTELLEALARLLVLCEEVEGASVPLSPHFALTALVPIIDRARKDRHDELTAMVAALKDGRPPGPGRLLAENRFQQVQLGEVGFEEAEIDRLIDSARMVAA